MFNDQKQINRVRRRSVKISTNAKTLRTVFDELVLKELIISEFIDLYNHFINETNVIDQLRCYYNTQRVHYKI